jgi:hypothetical protein
LEINPKITFENFSEKRHLELVQDSLPLAKTG